MSSLITEKIRLIESNNSCKVIKYSSKGILIVLTDEGHVYTWNEYNQSQNLPEILSFSVNNYIIDICCGPHHTFILNKFGYLYGFGQNSEGQLGCGFISDSELNPVIVLIPENEKVISISCGDVHAVALTLSGNAYSWGDNEFGQLGINSDHNIFEHYGLIDSKIRNPVMIDIPEYYGKFSIRKVACGSYHSILLSNDGDVYLFGGKIPFTNQKVYQDFGNQRCFNEQKIPFKVKSDLKFVDISAHYDKSIALSENGKFYVWGDCLKVYYATPTEIEAKSFAEIYEKIPTNFETTDCFQYQNDFEIDIEKTLNVKIIKCVSLMNYNNTVLTNTGKVFQFRNFIERTFENIYNKVDKTLENTSFNESDATKFKWSERIFPEPIIDVSSGLTHVLYLCKDGSVYASGFNTTGAMGCLDTSSNNIEHEELNPMQENILKAIKESKIGMGIVLETLKNANVLDVKFYYYPEKVIGLNSKVIIAIACGESHSLLLTSKGKVYGSGLNNSGQLFFKDNFIFGFIKIFNKRCIKIACGDYHSLVLSSNGKVYGFGLNNCGQIGNGYSDFDNQVWKPYSYKENPKFIDIFAKYNFSLALSEDGFCYVWGNCFQVNHKIPTKTEFQSIQETLNYYTKLNNQDKNDTIKSTAQYQWFESWNMLGEGNFSRVVKACNLLEQKDFAVRVRAINYDKIPEIWKELNIWCKLKSDYITPILDFWFDENTDESSKNFVKYIDCANRTLLLSIKTEVCDSRLTDLMCNINDEFNLKPSEKLNEIAYFISSQIFVQILEGVNYLHRLSPPVIHRDLKPDNILIKLNDKNNYFVRINDFGLSNDHEVVAHTYATNVGTPKYKSHDRTVTTKSDLYSLGIILSDLMHINLESFEDYEIENDCMIDRKYKHSALLCEQLIQHKSNLRPDCNQMLISIVLWAISNEENQIKSEEINNHLLKEIFQNISAYDFELKLLLDLQNCDIETISGLMKSVNSYLKTGSLSHTIYIKILEKVLLLIEKFLIVENISVLMLLSEALHLLVNCSEFKINATEVLTREVIKKLLDLLTNYGESSDIAVNVFNTLVMLPKIEQFEFDAINVINIVFQTIQNVYEDKRNDAIIKQMCCHIIYSLAFDKSNRQLIGTENGIEILIQQLFLNGKANDNNILQEYVWVSLYHITDENEKTCDHFYKANGLEAFIVCYYSTGNHLNCIIAMFGVLQHFAECSTLRHYLLNEVIMNILVTNLIYWSIEDLENIPLFEHEIFLEISSKIFGLYNESLDVDAYNICDEYANENQDECRICVTGILSYLLSIDLEIWKKQIHKMPKYYDLHIKELVKFLMETWDIQTKRQISYSSFKPFLVILQSISSSLELKFWAIYQMANFTCINRDKYCPYLEEDNLINLIVCIVKDKTYSEETRLNACKVMESYKYFMRYK